MDEQVNTADNFTELTQLFNEKKITSFEKPW